MFCEPSQFRGGFPEDSLWMRQVGLMRSAGPIEFSTVPAGELNMVSTC